VEVSKEEMLKVKLFKVELLEAKLLKPSSETLDTEKQFDEKSNTEGNLRESTEVF
jgi:hypothetical protein